MRIPSIRNINTGLKLVKTGVKDAIREEDTVTGELKRLLDDVREATEKGKVYTKGVTDDEAKAAIDKVSDGLSSYAKANKLNVIFHTPSERECGYVEGEKTIGVSVYTCGLFNSYCDMTTVNGDVNKITKFKGDKLEAEDTFTRRMYRTVEQLANNINAEKQHDAENSFWGVTKAGIKDDADKVSCAVKKSFQKGCDSVKKYIKKEIKFIKDEFTGKGTSDY